MTVPPPPHDPSASPEPTPHSGSFGQPGGYGQPVAYGQPGAYEQPRQPGAWGQGHPDQPGPSTGMPSAAAPAPGTDLAADLGDALRFAGNALLRNPVAYLVTGLIYVVVMSIIIGGGVVAAVVVMVSRIEDTMATATATDSAPIGEFLLLYAVVFGIALLSVPFTLLWQAGSGRAAEVVLEGGRPTIGQAMMGPMRIILTALLVAVITFVGLLLLYIPGLIAGVMLMYAIPAAARGASPIEAVKESFALAKNNLGTTIVAYLVLGVISSIASMLVVTVLVAVPFMVLFEIGMYERLRGRALPDPAKG